MSHNITGIDLQQGLRQAWHGLTQILEKITLSESWLSKWDVEKRPMREPDGEESEFCRIVCTDDPKIKIGKPVHCTTYGLIDNREFLGIVQESLLSIRGAAVESVGSVCERGRIFVSVSVPEVAELKAAGRVFLPYLNFLSSHDMSAPFMVNLSTVCTVCDNTFRSNLHDEGNKTIRARVPHTKNASKALANIPQIIDAYFGTVAEFGAIMNRLASEPIDLAQTVRFFAGFLTVKDDSEARKIIATRPGKDALEISTRRANQIDRLCELFRIGPGNRGENRADVFSAVTDYYSHESSGGCDNAWKQVASSEFGAGQTAKDYAFETLQDGERTNRLIEVGDLVLAAN